MSTRLRVSESGTAATAADIASNAAIGKLLSVIATGTGLTVDWRTIAEIYSAAWAIADWYIDGTTGNDANNGTTAGTPLRTGAELARRLGPYALWGQSVTVHVLANGMTDALLLRGAMLVAGTQLDIVGAPTLLANAGTIATIGAIDHVTPLAPYVTTTLIADWTPYIWARLRTTDGANDNAVTWIAKANPGGVGLATARTPRWTRLNPAGLLQSAVTPAVGSTVVVESLPNIPAINLLVDGPLAIPNTNQNTTAQWRIREIACQDITATSTGQADANYSIIFGCRVANIMVPKALLYPNSSPVAGCFFDPSGHTTQTLRISVCLGPAIAQCLFGTPNVVAVHPYLYTYAGQVANCSNCLFQAAGVNVSPMARVNLSNCQFFDATIVGNPPIFLEAQGALQLSNVSGTDNTTQGALLAQNGSQLKVTGTYNLLSSGGQVFLSSTPALTLTSTQAFQTADYAQKGTAALVAGTVTVTVPWYDSATQKVTASHATFAGTPGILSVQQISTTQFTITSSNALDTSTVNWQISALGRNIFVSTS